MVLTIGLQVFVAAPAPADIVQGTNGTMDITYNQVINGDFISVGNGLLQCSGTNANNGGTCAQMYSQAPATGTTSNNYVNDLYQMIAYNGGTGRGVTTVNSSSATFAVPQGATIVKAMLYWSANTGQNSTGTGWTGTGSATCGSSAGGATYPASGALNWQTQAPVFSVNGGAYATAPAIAVSSEPALTSGMTRYYSGQSDITSLMQGMVGTGTGTVTTMSVGNVWSPTGYGCYAGWTMSLVYDYGQAISGNPYSVARQVVLYDGHQRIYYGQGATGNSLITVPSTTPPPSTRSSRSPAPPGPVPAVDSPGRTPPRAP